MTTEPTAEEKALATAGATKADLDAGASGEGAPKAPLAPSNEKPAAKEGIDEVHGETDPVKVSAAKKVADDKAAADKVVADKAAADKAEADGPLKSFITLDDPAGQAAINLLKETGLGPNEADKYFAKAIASGDLKDIDVAGLEAKIGKDKTVLVMAGVQAYYGNLASKAEATVKATHEIFGGEENWKSVRAWAQSAEKADPAVKKQINDIRGMLDEGGMRATAGARELLRMYNAAPDTKGLGVGKLVVGDNSGTVIGQALTRSAYLTELKAAHARGAKPAEINAIDQRRRAGKAQGI